MTVASLFCLEVYSDSPLLLWKTAQTSGVEDICKFDLGKIRGRCVFADHDDGRCEERKNGVIRSWNEIDEGNAAAKHRSIGTMIQVHDGLKHCKGSCYKLQVTIWPHSSYIALKRTRILPPKPVTEVWRYNNLDAKGVRVHHLNDLLMHEEKTQIKGGWHTHWLIPTCLFGEVGWSAYW